MEGLLHHLHFCIRALVFTLSCFPYDDDDDENQLTAVQPSFHLTKLINILYYIH